MSLVGSSPLPARPDPARRRAWLVAAAAVLLLLIWQTVDLTYLLMRPPPYRYTTLSPGAVAHGRYGDLRLLSWQQSPYWGVDFDDRPSSPDLGAVWVVAQLEITPRLRDDYFGCDLFLVGEDGRSWSSVPAPGTAAGEPCVPDPETMQLGQTYRFRLGYEVPADQVDRLAGISENRFTLRREALMVPSA